jgi:hypothetical protein
MPAGIGSASQVFADASAEGADCPQLLVRHAVERVQRCVELAARPNEITVRCGGDAEARGDREACPGQLAKVRALPADGGQPRRVHLAERQRVGSHGITPVNMQPFSMVTYLEI